MKTIKTMLAAIIAVLALGVPVWASPKTVALNVSGMT